MRSLYFLALALVGCASAEPGRVSVVDSGTGGQTDGSGSGSQTDASMTGGTDAATGPCTVMTRDLLTNSNFEGTPAGTGWTETSATPPLVTAQTPGVVAQSPTIRAWLGGATGAPARDDLYQDVLVPASTTMLVVTGFYEVRTGETGTTVYDSGKAEITTTAGTQIELIKSFDNVHPTTAWTALDKTLTNLAMMKGQTVRLHFSATNDNLVASSFFFDTLHLNATVCE
jgi:hypothetical protein